MIPAASNVVFTVGFTVFVIAFVVLLVLSVRFILQRASVARRQWLAERLDVEAADDDPPDEEEPARPRTALVLSGGGTRGAAQVGMLQVLAEGGFVPDRIYGSSVGAVNGAAFAGDPTVQGVEHLTRIWRGLSGEDVFPQRRGHGPWRFLQQREAIHASTGLRRIVEEGLAFDRLEDATIPFEVVATSIVDGRERWFTSGSAVEAVMASAAIPAIFPAVEIDSDRLIDGGVVDNVPIGRAIEAGATTIVVLLCGPPMYSPSPAKRPVDAMLNALFISLHARFVRELSRLPEGVEVIVCSAGATATRDYTDFSDTEALMAAGRAEAVDVLSRYGIIEVPRSPAEVEPAEPEEPDDPSTVTGEVPIG
jgi:NTE family protein